MAHGLGEPLVGRAQGERPEAGERLVPDGLPGPQVHDRLERHRDALPGHEPFDLVAPLVLRLLLDLLAPELGRQLLHDPAHHLAGQVGPAVHDLLDRRDDLLGGGSLHEVADGPRPQHLEHGRAVLERAERDHAGVGGDADDLARRPGPTAGGHLHVDERDVGLGAHRELDRLVGIARRAHEADRVLVGEEVGQGDAERGLVVGDQHADLIHVVLGADGQGSTDGGHVEDRTRVRVGPQAPRVASARGTAFGVGPGAGGVV